MVTDHNPFAHLPTQPNLSRRQVRWVDYLSQFVNHGSTNLERQVWQAADALSRFPHHKDKASTLAVHLCMKLTNKRSVAKPNLTETQLTSNQPSKARRTNLHKTAGSTVLPEGPGSQGGDNSPSHEVPLPTSIHTEIPEGTLNIYEAIITGYSNDPYFQGKSHTAHYVLKDGFWYTKANQCTDMAKSRKQRRQFKNFYGGWMSSKTWLIMWSVATLVR